MYRYEFYKCKKLQFLTTCIISVSKPVLTLERSSLMKITEHRITNVPHCYHELDVESDGNLNYRPTQQTASQFQKIVELDVEDDEVWILIRNKLNEVVHYLINLYWKFFVYILYNKWMIDKTTQTIKPLTLEIFASPLQHSLKKL